MDIMELLTGGGDPQQQQLMAANMLRNRQEMNQALVKNRQQSQQYDMLNFAAQAAGNNQPLAAATGALQKTAQARARLTPVGQSAVVVGDQMLENPEYADNQAQMRQQHLLQAAGLLQARREQSQARSDTADMMEEGRNERAQQSAELRAELAAMTNSIRQQQVDARTAAAGKGKVMSAGEAAKIGDSEMTRDQFLQLAGSFKSEFGGHQLAGSLENTMGRLVGGKYADQANWWQNYAEQTNKVRHALFGSALTANEQKAFEQQTITPQMDSGEITRRLAQQTRAAALAHAKLVGSLGKAGYNVDNFNVDVPGAPVPGGNTPATIGTPAAGSVPLGTSSPTPVPGRGTPPAGIPTAPASNPRMGFNGGSQQTALGEQLAIMQQERYRATDPKSIAALDKEIVRLQAATGGGRAPAPKRIKVDINGNLVQ